MQFIALENRCANWPVNRCYPEQNTNLFLPEVFWDRDRRWNYYLILLLLLPFGQKKKIIQWDISFWTTEYFFLPHLYNNLGKNSIFQKKWAGLRTQLCISMQQCCWLFTSWQPCYKSAIGGNSVFNAQVLHISILSYDRQLPVSVYNLEPIRLTPNHVTTVTVNHWAWSGNPSFLLVRRTIWSHTSCYWIYRYFSILTDL